MDGEEKAVRSTKESGTSEDKNFSQLELLSWDIEDDGVSAIFSKDGVKFSVFLSKRGRKCDVTFKIGDLSITSEKVNVLDPPARKISEQLRGIGIKAKERDVYRLFALLRSHDDLLSHLLLSPKERGEKRGEDEGNKEEDLRDRFGWVADRFIYAGDRFDRVVEKLAEDPRLLWILGTARVISDDGKIFRHHSNEVIALEFARSLLKVLKLVKVKFSEESELWWFDGRVLRPNGEELVNILVTRILSPFELGNTTMKNEIVRTLFGLVPISVDRGELDDLRYLPLQNCVIDLETLEILSYDELADLQKFFTQYLPYEINFLKFEKIKHGELKPHEISPEFHAFLSRFYEGENLLKLQLVLGFVLLPTVTKRPFCLVIGERDTGKTTLKEVLKCVLNDFVAVSTLDSIQERFGLAKLVGKRLVISSERPRRLVDVEIIKRLTGGETISVEMKFKDPFEAVIDPVFIFLMNSAPRFKKLDDEAFLQRFVVIETSNPLTPEEKDRRVREKLLQNPEDILLYLIWCYIELLKRNLIIPQDETEVMEVLLSGLGDVRDFFDEVVEVEFGEVIEGSGLYDFYTYWCAQNGRHVVSRNRFYQDFTEIGARRGVLKGRNSKNKSVCFLNVKIKDEFKREFELLKKVSDNEEKGGREEPPLEEFSRDEESEVKQIEMKDSEENSERSLCYSPALRWEENTRAIEHSIFADERFENMRIELLHALERGDLDHATQTLFKTIRDRVYARDPEVGIKFRKILSGDKERNEIKLLKDILAFFETHRERILKKLKEEVETDG